MVKIEFRRWGAGPDNENPIEVRWPAVPRINEQVFIEHPDGKNDMTGDVRKVEWDAGGAATVWLK